MASTDKETELKSAEDKAKENKGKVADYLAAPRKKRKSYVIMALSRSVKDELASGIEHLLKTNFKTMAISSPKTPDELTKNFSRQIVLLIFDDEFTDMSAGMEIIADLKKHKSQAVVPVLFLTRRPAELIASYGDKLAPFHESDDYIDYARAEPNHIYSKIRNGLTTKNRRKSRRYFVDLPMTYLLLADDKMHQGRLLDLSIHGALLRAEDARIFVPGEQLKLHIPVGDFLPSGNGDYLKLSARVRRVFIAGTQAGISFEYMSSDRLNLLTRFLTEMVNEQNIKRIHSMRGRSARP